MDVRAMESITTTEQMQKGKIIPFRKELDLTLVNIAQAKADLNMRNQRARNYSRSCKAKANKVNETLECVLSGISAFAFIGAVGFLMWFFM